jgi:cytochrome c5
MRPLRRTPPPRAAALALAASLVVVTAQPARAAEPQSGEAVYEQVCKTCHTPGLLGAPKLGDRAAWKPLIAEGQTMLSRTSIKGIRQMPPKGGRPDLSDLEVRRAVVYMANAAGAKWKEPAR